MKTVTLNNENFESTITGNTTPVLVDFWAEWCGPCKMIGPVLNELATEQDGKVVIAKVNIDEAPELAARFGITAIPTLIVFKNGQTVTTLRGAQSKSTILKSLALAA
ncbi:MAG: thioredoxin [Verrucomicrobiota bacterium]